MSQEPTGQRQGPGGTPRADAHFCSLSIPVSQKTLFIENVWAIVGWCRVAGGGAHLDEPGGSAVEKEGW